MERYGVKLCCYGHLTAAVTAWLWWENREKSSTSWWRRTTWASGRKKSVNK